MDDDFKSIGDYLAIAWRRKGLIFIVFVLSLSIIAAVVFKLPPRYKSTGTILIKSQQIPEELVQSTVKGYANVRINTLSQSILSSQQLKQIIEKFGLYEEESKIASASEILGNMRKSIEIKQISADLRSRRSRSSAIMSFTIAFEYGAPDLAQKVASELVTLFLDENVKSRTASAAQTTEFLEKESDRLRSQIEAVEEQIAIYKQQNKGSLPENLNLNLTRQKELDQLLFDSKREMNTLKEKKKLLLIDLDIAKRTDLNPPPENQLLTEKQELENQLIQVRAELGNLSQKYSDEHPDIKRLKRKQTNLAKSLKDYVEKPNVESKKDSPEVLQVTARINAIDDSMASLILAQSDLQQQISELNKEINNAPQVERGMDALVRDYEITKIKYQKIRNNLQKAELSMSLEEEQKSEQFSLLEPPQLPDKASKPNRPQLLLLGLVLSLGFGAGAATLAESLDSGIRGERALANITKVRPLVSIPYITSLQDEAVRKRNIVLTILAFILTVVAILLLVHNFYKPLDSIWFIMMQKLSLV